ncbi:hypothetical protein ACTXGW_10490, partial [Psychrobacter faecalis]
MNNLAMDIIKSNQEEVYKNNKKIYAKTKGYFFYPEEDIWILDKNKTVYLSQFKEILEDQVLQSFLK